MKEYFWSRFGFTIILSVLFVVATINQVNAQTATYPIRNLTLDTLGKTLLLNGDEVDRDGKLTEFSGSKVIKDWKVKYEHKGSMRGNCEPPVINISFDKTDSKGKAKELFTGLSTYAGYSKLQYQKLRLIPECDGWNDWGNASDVGFNGQLNVSLREYIVYKILRKFGVPTADIVGFTDITFVTSDSGYKGKSFRYMIVQRLTEQDDQIPFTKQYNFNSKLYESGEFESGTGLWRQDYDSNTNDTRLTSATIVNKSDNSKVTLAFDPDTTIKFLLLTNFLNVFDMGALHNEDWGIDLATGKVKIIPHGFDGSFSCYSDLPKDTELTLLVNALPESTRSSYQSAYYRITKEIFNNPTSLDKMIALVNEFPYSDVDKQKLIEYLKIRFYQYASYFNSADFASVINQKFEPQSVSLPFASETEYESHNQEFGNSCNRTIKDLVGVSVSVIGNPTLVYSSNNLDSNQPLVEGCPKGFACKGDPVPVVGSPVPIVAKDNIRDGQANFIIEVKTADSALQMSKSRFGKAFQVSLVGTHGSSEYGGYYQNGVTSIYTPISGNYEDYAGPYYIIPPNSTVRFSLDVAMNSYELVKDRYFVRLDSFKPNNNVVPLIVQVKTTSINLGSIEPMEMISPKASENLVLGNEYKIAWKGSPDRTVQMSIDSTNGNNWDITNPDMGSYAHENNEYKWSVGKMYTYFYNAKSGNSDYMLSDLDPGQYKITVRDAMMGNVKAESGYFNIVDSANSIPPTVSIIGTSTLTMILDPSGKEANLLSKFNVKIDAGSREQKIYKTNAFGSYLTSETSGQTGRGQQYYVEPVGVTDDGGDFYIIPANTKATFMVQSLYVTKAMFAGSYRGVLDWVFIGDYYKGKLIQVSGSNLTNSLTIIGEQSPYINTISPDDVPSNKTITISGVRFSTEKANIITLNSPYSDCSPGYTCETNRQYSVISKDGTTLQFVPNITPGYYALQVTHPTTGESNRAWINISTSTATVIQSVVPDQTKISSGQMLVLNYTIPDGAVNAKLMLYCPEGVSSRSETGVDICNKWFTFQTLPVSTRIILSNKMNFPQYVVPNLYVYFENDPNFAIGVSSKVTVLPPVQKNFQEASSGSTGSKQATSSVLPTATTLPITTNSTSPGFLSRALTSVKKAFEPAISIVTSLVNGRSSSVTSSPSPSPSSSARSSVSSTLTSSPTPSPTSSVRATITPSPTVSVRPTVTPKITPTQIPTVTPKPTSTSPSPSISPKFTSSPTPSSIATPSPVPTYSPIVTPIFTPTLTPTPQTAPSYTTPTPLGVPPVPSSSPTPSQTSVATPSATPIIVSTPSPTTSPTPSPAIVSSPPITPSLVPSSSPSNLPSLSQSPLPSSSPSAYNSTNNKSVIGFMLESFFRPLANIANTWNSVINMK